MKKALHWREAAALALVLIILSRCSGPTSTAGGSEIGNPSSLSARVVYGNGTPAAHAVVRVRHDDYLADTSSSLGKVTGAHYEVLTDDSGRFTIDSIDSGRYLIEAADANGNAVAAVCSTGRSDSARNLGVLMVRPMGAINGRVLGASRAFVRVRGLERCAGIDATGWFSMALPPGPRYAINAITADTAINDTLARPVVSSQTSTITIDAGTVRGDSAAVRAFLDSSGLAGVPVASVVRSLDQGRMRRLNLASRGLTRLHPSIGGLTFLWEISLDSNAITALPDTLTALPLLTMLSLAANPLDSLPMVVTRLRRLAMLVLDYSHITVLPDSLRRMDGLEVLWMQWTGATVVPSAVFSLPRIYSLNMRGDSLTAVPQSIGACTTLTDLDFSENRLDSLPASIGNLHKLQILYLYGNNLTSLPSTIGGWTNLVTLNLESNQLTSLPAEIGGLRLIQSLDIGGNKLTSLPDAITVLTPTSKFIVGGNSLCPNISAAVAAWIARYAGANWRTTQPQAGCP